MGINKWNFKLYSKKRYMAIILRFAGKIWMDRTKEGWIEQKNDCILKLRIKIIINLINDIVFCYKMKINNYLYDGRKLKI